MKPKPSVAITLREAAKLTGLSADYLRVAANRGAIPAKKVGRDWFVPLSWAERKAQRSE